MTPDDVRAAAEQLVEFHDRFAPLFGKAQAQGHAYTYLKGLMCCPERKSIEPIALCTGDGRASGLQKFIGVAPWQSDDVRAEIQAAFADELVPSAAGAPVGTVGVIDESGSSKKLRPSRVPPGMGREATACGDDGSAGASPSRGPPGLLPPPRHSRILQ